MYVVTDQVYNPQTEPLPQGEAQVMKNLGKNLVGLITCFELPKVQDLTSDVKCL